MGEKLIKIRYVAETVDLERVHAVFDKTAKVTNNAEKEVKEFSSASKKAGQDAGNAFKGASSQVDKFGKTVSSAKKPLLDFDGIATKIGATLAATFAAQQIISIGKKILDVTAEFQKFEAVLTNTLGSKSNAQIALIKIQDFAAKTPFSVRELTTAYIQLANRGIDPSTKSLTKIGDLAASLGKPLSQVNEAMLDVTNSERWTELGIKVTVNGDKITGTFRGMTVEAERSEKGALKLVEAFGAMEGVAGGMAAISETLGGKISNLGDSFDQLFKTIGESGSGIFLDIIKEIGELTDFTTRLLKSQQKLAEESQLKRIGKEQEEIAARYDLIIEDNIKLGQTRAAAEKTAFAQIKTDLENNIALYEKRLKLINATLRVEENETKQKKLVNEYKATKQNLELDKKRLESLNKLAVTEAESSKTQLGLLQKLKLELKEVQDLREKANSEKEIKDHTRRIFRIQTEIKRLEGLGEQAKRTKIDIEKLNGADFDGLTNSTKKLKDLLQQVNEKIFGSENLINKQRDAYISAIDEQIRARARQVEVEKLLREKEEKERIERQEREKQAFVTYSSSIADLTNAIGQYQIQSDNNKIAVLEQNKARELSSAGNNAKARIKIDQEYDLKLRQLRNKQAEREKRLAIFNAIIGTAQAIVKSLPNYYLAALAAATGAVQIATISGQKTPAYNKGTKSVPGPNTNRDTVSAKLTPGEMVIPVATKNKYNPILDAIFDHRIDPNLLNNIAKGKTTGGQLMVNDNVTLVQAIKGLPITQVSFDEDGFKRRIVNGSSRTSYYNSRYSSR